MTYVKAYTSERARKYLATSQGRRQLLELYLNPPPVAEALQGFTIQNNDQPPVAIKFSRRDIDTDVKPKA